MTGNHKQVEWLGDTSRGHGGQSGEATRNVARAEHHDRDSCRGGQFHRRHGVSPAEILWKQEAASIANMIPRK